MALARQILIRITEILIIHVIAHCENDSSLVLQLLRRSDQSAWYIFGLKINLSGGLKLRGASGPACHRLP